jgi:hypothetical protein
MSENKCFVLVFVKTGSINSGTDLKGWILNRTIRSHDVGINLKVLAIT